MAEIHDDPRDPARVVSRFEIVNAIAWILARADDLRANGRDPHDAFDRALQAHESTLAEIETRSSVRICQAARLVWASLADEDDPRLVAWVLARATDLRDDGHARHEAIEHAIADCQRTWERTTRERTAETHRVARHAWAAASKGAPRVGSAAIVDAIGTILERALALYQDGCRPGDAIALALNEHRASRDLARVAHAAWELAVCGSEASA